ncbi:MAG: ISKra4 family transposase [Verrucomicrobiota bacterium]
MARFQAGEPNGVAVQQLEVLVRTALFKPANALIGFLLQQAAERADGAYQPKQGDHWKGRLPLDVQGMFGHFQIWRDYYYNGKSQGYHPADTALGLEGAYTPALARLMCLEGAEEESFDQAEAHLRETGGIGVAARQIHRVVQRVGPAAVAWQARDSQPATEPVPVMYVSADGTGVPMRPAELVGRQGKQPDGTAKTRLAYLGCVFTQHGRDAQGHPLRDYQSTTYVVSFDTSEAFGLLLRREALRRGSAKAQQLVLLVDGAASLETVGRLNFPGAIQIVDFYHAMEHVGAVLEALWGKDHPATKKQRGKWAKLLLQDGVEKMIGQARQLAGAPPCRAKVEQALGYFVRNVARMQYGTFRQRGYFIGSGVIEAGCKTVIGMRCKQSGMRWSEPGAENILTFRCLKHSHRLDSFWKERLNQHAARNDALPLAA